VDFQITIPKILYLRVGTGSSYTTGVLTSVGTVDLIQFAPAAAVVGNGTAVAARAAIRPTVSRQQRSSATAAT